jgi:viologen exporter family transport system ATP-binding protein
MQAITARNLGKTYWFHDKQAGLAGSLRALLRGKKVFVEAVKGVNLEVKLGEVVGLIGPNGAGKTTTLKMLSGILHPTAGQLEVMGFLPFRREKAFLKTIAMVTGQRNRLFWDLPAEDYFRFCKEVYEVPDEAYHRNLRDLIELADIGDLLRTPQRKLSFGQRKRCELVAGLLHDPRVIFLDEPTNAMDLTSARRVREFIKSKGEAGNHTVVITSHNMADIEQVCDRVVIISRGKIVYDGTMKDLNRIDGFRKQMRVTLTRSANTSELGELGEIKAASGREVLLEVAADRAAAVASRLFACFPVQDISITDPPLEEIIEAIYARYR